MWLAPDATATWEAVDVGTRGGQLQYSDLAIETALPLRLVLTPLYVKTLVQAAWMISWRARKSVMTRW